MYLENAAPVEAGIKKALENCGRSRESLTLIAVSKTKPVEAVLEAYAAGQRDFGENKAQEMTAKREVCPADIRWHFIGNLQKNKVKYVVGAAYLIHSVSSLQLAAEIRRIAAKKGVRQPVLVEVNIADEATKQGLGREEALELVKAIADMPELELKGLMAIAPPVQEPEENRRYFRAMRDLLEEINREGLYPTPLTELSMGMSGDYPVAIEEGATFIRIGTALFGARDYGISVNDGPEANSK